MGGGFGGDGETPLNRTKPTENFWSQESRPHSGGKTKQHPQRVSGVRCGASTELLYNSTPIGSERKRQLNPLLGGIGE